MWIFITARMKGAGAQPCHSTSTAHGGGSVLHPSWAHRNFTLLPAAVPKLHLSIIFKPTEPVINHLGFEVWTMQLIKSARNVQRAAFPNLLVNKLSNHTKCKSPSRKWRLSPRSHAGGKSYPLTNRTEFILRAPKTAGKSSARSLC